jgi:hypothetical protein
MFMPRDVQAGVWQGSFLSPILYSVCVCVCVCARVRVCVHTRARSFSPTWISFWFVIVYSKCLNISTFSEHLLVVHLLWWQDMNICLKQPKQTYCKMLQFYLHVSEQPVFKHLLPTFLY